MSSEEPISLATAQNLDHPTVIPIAGGTLDINENAREGLFSTNGSTAYTVRADIGDFIMTSDAEKGTSIFTYALTPLSAPDTLAAELARRFIYFSIMNVSLVFKCIAPWSTASGSMQFFYNPDPENPLSSTLSVAIQQAMRLSQSKQLSSKGEAVVTCNIPTEQASQVFKGFRYCKQASNPMPRTESFGFLGGIVRGQPTIGDGTAWTVTLAITFVFKDMTFNSPISQFQIVVSEDIISSEPVASNDGSGYIYMKTILPSTGKVSTGYFSPYNIDNFDFLLVETQGTETVSERYVYTNNTAYYVDDGINLEIWLNTNFTPNRTALDDPESTSVSTTLTHLSGSLLYSEDAIGPLRGNNVVALKQSRQSFYNTIMSFVKISRTHLLNVYKRVYHTNAGALNQ